jgi:hypothetical protein
MIDLKAAREAMQGFSGLPGLPDSQEALKARTDALRKNAASIGHAARVVKALREQERTYPSVQAIVEICQQTPDDETITATSRDCSWCNGSGFIIIENEIGISAAWKCRHDGPPPANVGPVIVPSVMRHYQQEFAAAEIRRQTRGSVFA